MSVDPEDFEPLYRVRRGPHYELVSEEIELLKRLSDEVTRRTSRHASPKERRAAARELIEEDLDMAALCWRLEALSRSNDESVLLGLVSLGKEEAEEEEEEEEESD